MSDSSFAILDRIFRFGLYHRTAVIFANMAVAKFGKIIEPLSAHYSYLICFGKIVESTDIRVCKYLFFLIFCVYRFRLTVYYLLSNLTLAVFSDYDMTYFVNNQMLTHFVLLPKRILLHIL